MLQSEIAFINDPVFDGDVHDTALRGILSNGEFRQEQGEEDCQVLDQATIKATNTAPESMQAFCMVSSILSPIQWHTRTAATPLKLEYAGMPPEGQEEAPPSTHSL